MSASVIMMFASDEAATTFKNWMKALGGAQFVAHSKVMDPQHAIERFHYAVEQADKNDLFTAAAVIDRTMRNRTIVGIPDSAGVDSPQGFATPDTGIEAQIMEFSHAATVRFASLFGAAEFATTVKKLLAGEKVAMTVAEVEAVKKFNELFPGLVVPLTEVPPSDSVVNNTP